MSTTTAEKTPLLSPIPPQGSEENVARLYQSIQEAMGIVPTGLKLLSISPQLLEGQINMLAYYMQHPSLSGQLLAFIRLIVAEKATCRYCIGMNENMLVQMGYDLESVRHGQENPEATPLEEKEKVLLLFTLKSVTNPHAVNAEDLDAVRNAGWSDQDIFDAVNHAAYANAFDLVLNTFNVEHENAWV